MCVDLGAGPGSGALDCVRASVVRLVLLSNCQMGRDSRIRGIRLFTPVHAPRQVLLHEHRLDRFRRPH